MLGGFSFFVDGMGAEPKAHAAALSSCGGDGGAQLQTRRRWRPAPGHGGQQQQHGGRSPLDALLSPAVPLLQALSPCRAPDQGVPGFAIGARRG